MLKMMSNLDGEKLQVVLTKGIEDGGRMAAIGLGVALASAALGKETYLFLSLDAAALGTPTGCLGITPRGFTDTLEEHIASFIELGGHVEVCSSCYVEYCRHLPQGEEGALLRDTVGIESLNILVERAGKMPVVSF